MQSVKDIRGFTEESVNELQKDPNEAWVLKKETKVRALMTRCNLYLLESSFEHARHLLRRWQRLEGNIENQPGRLDSIHLSRNVWHLYNCREMLARVNCHTLVVNGIKLRDSRRRRTH